MMKSKCKIYCAVIYAVFSYALCGCTATAETMESSEAENKQETVLSETEAATDSVTETVAAAQTDADTAVGTESETSAVSENIITEAEIRRLFEENLYCVKSVFMSDHLAYSGEAVKDEHIYKVSDERFVSYTDFENYIKSVYCTSEADRLLYNYPYENTQMYTDVDGQLCIDSNYASAKAYFVDWKDTEIVVSTSDESRCVFSVMGYIEEPADVPVQEEYIASGAVVFENDKWLLETMIY